MRQLTQKTFINSWDSIFVKHPWIEAFLLSMVFHLIFLSFLWLCFQIHTMVFPPKAHENIIEIEFIKWN